ncbi:protein of unknown function [Paraburkholderia kururiensis]
MFVPSPNGTQRRTANDGAAFNGILYGLRQAFLRKACRRNWVSVERHDVLAAVPGVAGSRRVEAVASGDAWPLRAHYQIDWKWARLGVINVSGPGGPGKRHHPDSPSEARVKTAHCRGRTRYSDYHRCDGYQPARLDSAPVHARRHSSGASPNGQTHTRPGRLQAD